MPYFSFHYLMRHSKWVNNSRIINSQDIYTIHGGGANWPFNPPYTFIYFFRLRSPYFELKCKIHEMFCIHPMFLSPPHPMALYVKTSHKIFLIIYDAQKTNYNLTTWSLNILEKSCTITFIRANKIVTHTP